jgi:hypothetical protein
MPEETGSSHRILAGLCWAMLLLVEFQILMSFLGLTVIVDYLAVYLLVGVALLVTASNATKESAFAPYTLAGAWLAMLMLIGLGDAQKTLNWASGGGHDNSGWLGYVVVGLLISSVLILVSVSRGVAGQGLIWLTVYTGFLILIVDGVLQSVYGSDWEDFAARLGPVPADGYGWMEVWTYTPDLIRILTYIGLGYLVARRKGVIVGTAITTLVALADSGLGVLALALHQMLFIPSLWKAVMQLVGLGEVVGSLAVDLVARASILALLGLMGAMTTRVRWSGLSQVSSEGITT